MSQKIIPFYTPEDNDLLPVSLDQTRSTAVIIRRPPGHHQGPSLLVQQQLVTFAKLVRGEETDEHILVYTQEGAPGSQKQTTNLFDDITNGLISSIVAERPDRLIRHEHTCTTNLLRKQHITVIVPGKRTYDFDKEEDVKAFHTDTQEAHAYIATHIKHMHADNGREDVLADV